MGVMPKKLRSLNFLRLIKVIATPPNMSIKNMHSIKISPLVVSIINVVDGGGDVIFWGLKIVKSPTRSHTKPMIEIQNIK